MDFIERLKTKPEHIRNRIALGAASGITVFVAFIWMVAFTASDALVLTPISDSSANNLTAAFSQGSGASLLSAVGSLSQPEGSGITVVETETSSTLETKPADERTVIPF